MTKRSVPGEGDFEGIDHPARRVSGNCAMTPVSAWHALTVSGFSGDCGGNYLTRDGDYRRNGHVPNPVLRALPQ